MDEPAGPSAGARGGLLVHVWGSPGPLLRHHIGWAQKGYANLWLFGYLVGATLGPSLGHHIGGGPKGIREFYVF